MGSSPLYGWQRSSFTGFGFLLFGTLKVGTLTIYSFVIASVFSWQFLDVRQRYTHRLVDLYIPVFGILQLIFFLGWLKVSPQIYY